MLLVVIGIIWYLLLLCDQKHDPLMADIRSGFGVSRIRIESHCENDVRHISIIATSALSYSLGLSVRQKIAKSKIEASTKVIVMRENKCMRL